MHVFFSSLFFLHCTTSFWWGSSIILPLKATLIFHNTDSLHFLKYQFFAVTFYSGYNYHIAIMITLHSAGLLCNQHPCHSGFFSPFLGEIVFGFVKYVLRLSSFKKMKKMCFCPFIDSSSMKLLLLHRVILVPSTVTNEGPSCLQVLRTVTTHQEGLTLK